MEGTPINKLLDVTPLKLLSGRILAALLALPPCADAQNVVVPARDLLNFPIGLAGEAAAIGSQNASGIWNPAVIVMPDGWRWRIGAAAMNSAQDELGAQAQLVAVARRFGGTTFGATLLRASVSDLIRTDDSPLSIGDEIPYSTFMISLAAARRLTPWLTAGVAVRSRTGRADNVTRTSSSFDLGAVASHLGTFDASVGASTFLMPLPGGGMPDRMALQLATDFRVIGQDSSRSARAGVAVAHTEHGADEQFLFAAARWDRWEAHGGPVRTVNYGGAEVALRLGISVRYGAYQIGVAREESTNGLAPRYHFSLTSLLK